MSASAPSSHDLSLAAFTINIAESNFRHTQDWGFFRDRYGLANKRKHKSAMKISRRAFTLGSPAIPTNLISSIAAKNAG